MGDEPDAARVVPDSTGDDTDAAPGPLADDAEGRLWFVETHPEPNRFVGFDPETEEFFSITPIPSGAGAVRHMVFYADRNAIWFGTDTNNLGKASLPD